MRLLHSETYEVEEFIIAPPPYAILSHTWGEEEILFQEITENLPRAKSRKGFLKIEGCCRQARLDGYEWVWIDTCCIDKTSSAELSEAINSMFQWYRDAQVCYAYLCDVPHLETGPFLGSDNIDAVFPIPGILAMERVTFKASRWFTRGWTLQELIAPPSVAFYSCDWEEIGNKRHLLGLIAGATGIDEKVVSGEKTVSECTVAARMSWAAPRETTRPEDMAYCLLGIFDINMPLLYGEGTKAFLRLQQYIIRKTEDYSLFCFKVLKETGPLAHDPSCYDSPAFIRSIDMDPQARTIARHRLRWNDIKLRHRTPSLDGCEETEPPTITTRGLRLSIPILEDPLDKNVYFAYIFCDVPVGNDDETILGLCVELVLDNMKTIPSPDGICGGGLTIPVLSRTRCRLGLPGIKRDYSVCGVRTSDLQKFKLCKLYLDTSASREGPPTLLEFRAPTGATSNLINLRFPRGAGLVSELTSIPIEANLNNRGHVSKAYLGDHVDTTRLPLDTRGCISFTSTGLRTDQREVRHAFCFRLPKDTKTVRGANQQTEEVIISKLPGVFTVLFGTKEGSLKKGDQWREFCRVLYGFLEEKKHDLTRRKMKKDLCSPAVERFEEEGFTIAVAVNGGDPDSYMNPNRFAVTVWVAPIT